MLQKTPPPEMQSRGVLQRIGGAFYRLRENSRWAWLRPKPVDDIFSKSLFKGKNLNNEKKRNRYFKSYY